MRLPSVLLAICTVLVGTASSSAQPSLPAADGQEPRAFATPVRLSGHAGGVELRWTAHLRAPVAYYAVYRVADGREHIVATFTPRPTEGNRAEYRYIDQGPWHADLAFRVAATYADGRIASTPPTDATTIYGVRGDLVERDYPAATSVSPDGGLATASAAEDGAWASAQRGAGSLR